MIDDFIDEPTRQQLLAFLLHGEVAAAAVDAAAAGAAAVAEDEELPPGAALPPARWERRTTDMAGAAPTWGVKPHVLEELAAAQLPAVQARQWQGGGGGRQQRGWRGS